MQYKARTIIACLNPSVRQFNNEMKKKTRKRNNSYAYNADAANSEEMRGLEAERLTSTKSWMTIPDWVSNKLSNIHDKIIEFRAPCCCCYFQAIIILSLSLFSKSMICSWIFYDFFLHLFNCHRNSFLVVRCIFFILFQSNKLTGLAAFGTPTWMRPQLNCEGEK